MNRKELSSVLLNNGNILFSYRPYSFKDTWIYAVIPFIVVLAMFVAELLHSKTYYSVVLFFFAIPLSLWLWLEKRDKRNKKIEESIVNYHLQAIIEKDIKNIDDSVFELERLYEVIPVDDSTTYGKRRLVVGLSNGSQLIYNVENPKMLSNILLLEVNVKAIIK